MSDEEFVIKSTDEAIYPQVISFLQKNLQENVPFHIVDEYPLALSKDNMERMKVMLINDKVVSHCYWFPYTIETSIGKLKVAGIGSVVTDPNHRNKGYSTRVLESCLKDIKQKGFQLAILWSNLTEFYERLGFCCAGLEHLLIVTSSEIPSYQKRFIIEQYTYKDFEQIFNLYKKQPYKVIRGEKEFEAYLGIPETYSFVAKLNEEIKAYAVIGKGKDFQNYIHEWAGDSSAVIETIQHIAKTFDFDEVIVNIPFKESPIYQELTQTFPAAEGVMGMIKILNLKSLGSQISHHIKGKSSKKIIFSKDKDYIIKIDDKEFRLESEKKMVTLLFGPHNDPDIIDIATELNTYLKPTFPISMYIWGLDSV